MKIFAQFYILGEQSKQLVEACGSDSVLLLDSRLNVSNCLDIAHNHIKMLNNRLGKNYKAYAIFQGKTFSRSERITSIYNI